MAAASAGCRYGSFLSTACPPVDVLLPSSDLLVTITTTTTATAKSTTSTVEMIIPQGVCFWLTIDLPFLAGGRAPPGRPPAGGFVDLAEAGARLAPDLPAGGDLRWAMVLPSGCLRSAECRSAAQSRLPTYKSALCTPGGSPRSVAAARQTAGPAATTITR